MIVNGAMRVVDLIPGDWANVKFASCALCGRECATNNTVPLKLDLDVTYGAVICTRCVEDAR